MAEIPLTGNRRKRRSSGGGQQRRNGWRAKWSDELKLKVGGSTWVMLTVGDYPTVEGSRSPYLEVPMYKVQYTNKTGGTSWGYYQGNKEKCTLRDRADSEDIRVAAPKYGEPNRFFMNVVHLDLFRREAVHDKRTDAPMRYRHGKLKGEIVYRWDVVKSMRERREIIKSGDFSNCGFFRKKFLDMPFSHFEAIKGIGRTANKTCKCSGMLVPSVYSCSECGEELLDAEETDLTEDEVASYGDEKARCNSCGYVGYPKAHPLCDSCDDPRPLNWKFVAAQISKVREGQYPTYKVNKVIPITDYEFYDGTPAAQETEDGVALHPDLLKIAEVQFDLELYAAPKENAYYSDLLGLKEGDVGFVTNTTGYDDFR